MLLALASCELRGASELQELLARAGLREDLPSALLKKDHGNELSESPENPAEASEGRRAVRRVESDGGGHGGQWPVVRVGADNLPYLFYSDPRVVAVVRKVGVRRKVAPPLDVRVEMMEKEERVDRRRPRLVIMSPGGQAMPPNLIHLNERIKPRYSFKSRYPKRQKLAVRERGEGLGAKRMGRGVVRRRRLVSRRNRLKESP